MKICQYHTEALRTACAARGLDVRDSRGSSNPLFTAQSFIIAMAIGSDETILNTGPAVCPICALFVPSWIEKAAAVAYHLEQEKKEFKQ